MSKKHDHLDEQAAPMSDDEQISATTEATAQTAAQKLQTENQELVSHLQRLQAEFENYRKRVEREREEMQSAGNDALLRDFLAITDNLGLALMHAKDAEGNLKGEDLLAGIIMINEQLQQFLEHEGLQEVQTDIPFDPRLHEAINTMTQEGVAKGTILQVYQKGYARGDKVFRPAKVSVAK